MKPMNYPTLRRRMRARRIASAVLVLGLAGVLTMTGFQAIAGLRGGGPAQTRPEGRPSVTPPSPAQEPEQVPATLPRRTLRPGDRGPGVLALQRHLDVLGYLSAAADGSYGPVTEHAVMAFQKVHGLPADGVAGAATRRALLHPRTPTVRGTGSGLRVEVDLARQVLWVVLDGRIVEIYDVSTGNGETYWQNGRQQVAETPPGAFEVTWRVNGWRHGDLGPMYRPVYFNGGIAIHGSPSVPAYPASHGCVRVASWVMDALFDRLVEETPVLVF